VDTVSHERFRYGLIGAGFVLAILLFIRLPALGLRDGAYAGWPFAGWAWPRFWTSFVLPFAALAIVLIFKSLSRRDPFRANYGKFRRTYDLFLDLAVLLVFMTHFLIILSNLMVPKGLAGRWVQFLPTSFIGAVLIVSGNVMPRLRPNSVIGVRTRWTLADETVWMKTHRAGGYFLVVFGLTLIAWTFIDFQGIWWVLGPGFIVTIIGPPILSRLFACRERRISSARAQRTSERKNPQP
jgi:immunity protein, SdpI family